MLGKCVFQFFTLERRKRCYSLNLLHTNIWFLGYEQQDIGGSHILISSRIFRPVFELCLDGHCNAISLHRIQNCLICCVVSDFRREVNENCGLLSCYTASSGNSLPTFRDKL